MPSKNVQKNLSQPLSLSLSLVIYYPWAERIPSQIFMGIKKGRKIVIDLSLMMT